MKYQLSSKRPPVVAGKTIPIRVKLRGRQPGRRPKPYLTNKSGIIHAGGKKKGAKLMRFGATRYT